MSDLPIEDQIKFWMLVSDYTNSGNTGPIAYGSMHGSGSPIMEQIAIYGQYDITERKNIVRKLAGRKEGATVLTLPLLKKRATSVEEPCT